METRIIIDTRLTDALVGLNRIYNDCHGVIMQIMADGGDVDTLDDGFCRAWGMLGEAVTQILAQSAAINAEKFAGKMK